MNKYIFITIALFTKLTAGYSTGDIISHEDQSMIFSFCYPSDSTGTFSLSQHSGKAVILDISASW